MAPNDVRSKTDILFYDETMQQKRKRDAKEDAAAIKAIITRCLSSNTLKAMIEKKACNDVTVTKENCMKKIQNAVQTYGWGKVGSRSEAARLKEGQANGDFEIDEFTPYAELWIGTHPSGPSTIGNTTLKEYVSSNPSLHCGSQSKADLTFLLKVLSINKVLSIQAHPDRELASQLHTDRPNVYKDPNHKPEMAIAMTDDVEGMCGFRTIEEILTNLRDYPELCEVVGTSVADSILKEESSNTFILQKLFHAYMTASKDLIAKQLNRLLRRLRLSTDEADETQELILRLADQFPGDSGIMAPLLLNHIRLKKGEAFFIGANEPHAYIYGDIVECMACSDNVVRAGLTPKLKDVPTLVSMLTYNCSMPEITRGKKVDECATVYAPPVEDFAVEMITVDKNQSYDISNVDSPAVLLTLRGSAKLRQDKFSEDVREGTSLFVSANTKTSVYAGADGVCIVRAIRNIYLPSL